MAENCFGSWKAGSDVKTGLPCNRKRGRPHLVFLLLLWCLQSRDPGMGILCVCDGQSDRHQAGGRHKVDGHRQTDGWVTEADGSRSVGRQDDGQ